MGAMAETGAREKSQVEEAHADFLGRFPDYKKTAVLDDIRVLEMYERAIRHSLPLAKRAGNWVQEYFSHSDAMRFIEAQFKEPSRIRHLLER